MNKLVNLRAIGALEVLGIPFDPLTFSGPHGEISDQNGFGQATGIAKVGHRARFVFAFAGLHKFPLLSLVTTRFVRNSWQLLFRWLVVRVLVFWQKVVLRTVIVW